MLPVDAVKIGGVQQQTRLFSDRADHPRVRVADIGHGHARHRIQVFTAGLVPQAGAQPLGKTQGQWLISAHQVGGGHGFKLHRVLVFLQYR
ncbi:hypothetical protein D3C78_1371480 [compost metagenome]